MQKTAEAGRLALFMGLPEGGLLLVMEEIHPIKQANTPLQSQRGSKCINKSKSQDNSVLSSSKFFYYKYILHT
jgi:hypothetical protein